MAFGLDTAYNLASQVPAARNPNTLKTVLDLLGSKGGQTAVSAAGAGLSAYGASKDRAAAREEGAANRALSARQFAAQMGQRQFEGDRDHALTQATAGAAASPLGQDQSFAQQQAIRQAILGGMRNYSATPGDPAVAAAMGSQTGGVRIPEGGFDPAMIERLFGDKATMASLAQRAAQVGQINPRGPVADYGTLFGADGVEMTNNLVAQNKAALDAQMAQEAEQRALIQRAIDEDIAGEKQAGRAKKKGGGFLGGLLKVAKVAAPIALAATGVGIPAAIGVSAGLNALDAKRSGAGLGGTLMAAGLGGASAAIPGGAVSSIAKKGLGAAVRDPRTYLSALGAR